MLMERVNYTHQNPVRGGLVTLDDEYLWSSVRCWNGNVLEEEPLLMDLDRIKWRRVSGSAAVQCGKPLAYSYEFGAIL